MFKAVVRNSKRRQCTAAFFFAMVLAIDAAAEVVFDGTTGPGGSLSGAMIIPHTQGTSVGNNLYHSFSTFNVNTGETAFFTGPTNVLNIINRVTGTSFSNIDGALRHTMPNADFWLINPNGILFGENASLPTSGAFHASSADYLRADDGGRFGADTGLPENTVLTTATPSSFGFLDNNIGAINVENSNLQVDAGETLSLVGGDVFITGGADGQLLAPSGTISFASVRSMGEAAIGNDGVDVSSFEQRGDISLSQNGHVSVLDATYGEQGAGGVYIRGGQFVMADSRILANTYDGTSDSVDIDLSRDFIMRDGSGIGSTSLDVGHSSDISLRMEGDLVLVGGSYIRSSSEASGDSGAISVTAENLYLSEGSAITSVTYGTGDAGNLDVTVADTIRIEGDFHTRLGSDSFALFEDGNSGEVNLSARVLSMHGGVISTESGVFSFGGAGNLQVNVDAVRLSNSALISSSTRGPGGGGDLLLKAGDTVSLSEEAQIASGTSLHGNAGDILIHTPELTLDGRSLIQAQTFQSGHSGSIDIQVDRLRVSNSSISVDALFNDSGLSTGDAGNITIIASESIELENPKASLLFRPRISSTAFGAGDGGIISIETAKLQITNGAINADTTGPSGNAGDIVLDVETLILLDGGIVSSDVGETSTGRGGNVSITAEQSVTIAGQAPGIIGGNIYSGVVTSTRGQGDAGTIELFSPAVDIVTGWIAATTDGSGAAGKISLNHLDSLTLSDGGSIAAATLHSGAGGDISIDSRTISIRGTDPDNDFSSGVYANTRGSGDGGSIQIKSEKTAISDGARLRSNSTGSGDAGSIFLLASDELTLQHAVIETSSEQSAGGNIVVNAGNLVYLLESEVTAEAQGVSPGNDGGNISIDPTFIVLNNSAIVAKANAGNGGNIELVAEALIVDPSSVIDASSATGIDGQVIIETPDRDIAGDIVALNAEFLDVSQLLRRRCAAASLKDRSSFTVDTSDGMPNSPDIYINGIYTYPLANKRIVDSVAGLDSGTDNAVISLTAAPLQWVKSDCHYR